MQKLDFNGQRPILVFESLQLEENQYDNKDRHSNGDIAIDDLVRHWQADRLYQYTHIQKHHLQLTLLVNAPPKTGPKQVARPNTLTTKPRYIGLFARGTVYLTIPKAPWNSPAAPTPAIARPKMNIGESRAAAQMIEPTIPL